MKALLLMILFAQGPAVSYPPPRIIDSDPSTRCDTGVVLGVEQETSLVTVGTPAGPVTYHVTPTTQITSQDGWALVSSELGMGDSVRVYYFLAHGAWALEVDVVDPPFSS